MYNAFDQNIAGIGRDDDSELNQKQSLSIHNGALVTIGNGVIAADNAANTNNFSSYLSFLIWGNDGGSTVIDTTCGICNRMQRIWAVQETGTINDVAIRIPQSAFSANPPILLISTDTNFDENDTRIILTDDGNGNYAATVDFSNGNFFTFGELNPPQVIAVDSVQQTEDGDLQEGEATRVALTQLQLTFDQAMENPAGNSGANDVTNPDNYLLVEAGVNTIIDTLSCIGTTGDDTSMAINAVSYDAMNTATIDINGNTPLPIGDYRLYACGATLMSDAGLMLDGDGDTNSGDNFTRDFSVADTDGDNDPDFSDPDDDGDTISDSYEIDNGLDPLDPSDAGLDLDGDGLTNLQEFNLGLEANNPDTDGDEIDDNLDPQPLTIDNDCTMDEQIFLDIVDTISTCGAKTSITVNSPAEITNIGNLRLISPTIILNRGFSTAGELHIISSDPCAACLP